MIKTIDSMKCMSSLLRGEREIDRQKYMYNVLDIVKFPSIRVAPFVSLLRMYKSICSHTASPTEYIVEFNR